MMRMGEGIAKVMPYHDENGGRECEGYTMMEMEEGNAKAILLEKENGNQDQNYNILTLSWRNSEIH